MPKRPGNLDLVGIIVETDQRITGKYKSTVKSGGWGSDFMRTAFGPLFNFVFKDTYTLTFLTEFRTERQYTDDTMGIRYFGHREINKSDSSYVYFYRLALIIQCKF